MRNKCSRFAAALRRVTAAHHPLPGAVVILAAMTVLGLLPLDQRMSANDTPANDRTAEGAKQEKHVPTSLPLITSEADTRVRQALQKLVSINVEAQPLNELLEQIGKDHNVQFWIDPRAFVDLALTTDTPITKKFEGISLESALHLILRPLQLAFRIEDGVLQVTSQAEYDAQTVVRIYPVGDLTTPFDSKDAALEPDFDAIIDVIESTIGPTTWNSVGGLGSMEPSGASLVIAQTPEIHEQIEGLLVGLRNIRPTQHTKPGGATIDPFDNERKAAIRKALRQPVDWKFNETPLVEVVEFITRESAIEVELDDEALQDVAITKDDPITFTLRDTPMESALRLLLRPLSLTYMIRDEVLLITSGAEKESDMRVRVYPVGDLLDCKSDAESDCGLGYCDFDRMIDMISSTVEPTSWDSAGGLGSVQAFEGAKALVISQTDEQHEQIEGLFTQLRKAKQYELTKPVAERNADELVVRVYALWKRVPKQAQKQQDSSNKKQEPTDAKTSSKFGSVPPDIFEKIQASIGGIGGGYSSDLIPAAHQLDEIPPAGVPASQAALVIRRLIEPESWNKQGVVLLPVVDRLVIKQTRQVHRKIRELLEQLGPWKQVDRSGDIGMFGIGGGLREGSRNRSNMVVPRGPHWYGPFQ